VDRALWRAPDSYVANLAWRALKTEARFRTIRTCCAKPRVAEQGGLSAAVMTDSYLFSGDIGQKLGDLPAA